MWFAGVDPPDIPISAGGCVVLPNLLDDRRCNRASRGKTVLDFPICDECWDAVKEER